VGESWLFFDLFNFQLPLRIKNAAIWTPKTTAAVESEAANVLMLWLYWPCPFPALPSKPLVELDRGPLVVADIVSVWRA
jgi:hypothetical protein